MNCVWGSEGSKKWPVSRKKHQELVLEVECVVEEEVIN